MARDIKKTPDMNSDNGATKKTHVVIFCGGRGSASIIHELLRRPNIHLTLIVNAYDDGLSTGSLRKFIAKMLGPSDFRKNLSYLVDPHSEGQIALKKLLEFRIPQNIDEYYIKNIIDFITQKKKMSVIQPLTELMEELGRPLLLRINQYLQTFFNYQQNTSQSFDYSDCSIGNLIFAGAYLINDHNFNKTTEEISQVLCTRALLLNVSEGENRILVALKKDGELLYNETQIVNPQSSIPIYKIFFLEEPLSTKDKDFLKNQSVLDKETWLSEHEKLPIASPAAIEALKKADIILFGPGTQHSSLFPSYRIIYDALIHAKAPVKALVMNLAPDHDIHCLSASDIADRALMYMEDNDNHHQVITHILVDTMHTQKKIDHKKLTLEKTYKNAEIIIDDFINHTQEHVHNGLSVTECVLSLWEKRKNYTSEHDTIDFFVDLHKRSIFLDVLINEFSEINWKRYFSKITLTLNNIEPCEIPPKNSFNIVNSSNNELFPEVNVFFDWLTQKKTEYLVLITGDGEYRFRDVILAIQVLERSSFSAVLGSRNQSNIQFKSSLQASYGEKKLLRLFSFLGAFLVSAIIALRFKIIFSDPLTGFRVFKRSRMAHLANHPHPKNMTTPTGIIKYLIKNRLEIAELPVNYRTFSGFSDPHWRIKRGIKNLLCTIS